jgi:hypothetical protein
VHVARQAFDLRGSLFEIAGDDAVLRFVERLRGASQRLGYS